MAIENKGYSWIGSWFLHVPDEYWPDEIANWLSRCCWYVEFVPFFFSIIEVKFWKICVIRFFSYLMFCAHTHSTAQSKHMTKFFHRRYSQYISFGIGSQFLPMNFDSFQSILAYTCIFFRVCIEFDRTVCKYIDRKRRERNRPEYQ